MVSQRAFGNLVGTLLKKNDGFFQLFSCAGQICKKPQCNLPAVGSKERGDEDLNDFRLTNLVGGLYKLLTKVLVSRLKKK